MGRGQGGNWGWASTIPETRPVHMQAGAGVLFSFLSPVLAPARPYYTNLPSSSPSLASFPFPFLP